MTTDVPADAGRQTPPVAQALMLTELFPPAVGGTPVLFEALYGRLAGIDVTVLADSGESVAGRTLRPHPSLRVVRAPIRTRRWGLLDLQGTRHHLGVARQVRRLGERRPTIVHCGRVLPEGVAAWLNRLWPGGAPYACWAHGEDLVTARKSRELTWMTERVLRRAAATLANSHNTARLVEAFGVPSSRIHVIHPGVDLTRFRPDVDGRALRARFARGDERVLLAVGRLQRRKGHDVAIQALGQLRDCPDFRYVIAGDGEERPRLERIASEAGVADRVTFAGEVTDAELPALYAAADIFLMPNRVFEGDIEGFGIVFLEAAAAGRPVIGGRSGGVPEAVADGSTGLLVDGADPAAVAAALRALLGDPARGRQMGEAGRRRAESAFSWDRAATQLAQVHHLMAQDLSR